MGDKKWDVYLGNANDTLHEFYEQSRTSESILWSNTFNKYKWIKKWMCVHWTCFIFVFGSLLFTLEVVQNKVFTFYTVWKKKIPL